MEIRVEEPLEPPAPPAPPLPDPAPEPQPRSFWGTSFMAAITPSGSRLDIMWWEPSGGFIEGLVHGPLPSKANSRKIVTFGKGAGARPALIKSNEARKFEAHFQVVALASRLKAVPLDGKLWLEVVVYQENMRRDLECELLKDCLQRSGVVKNDRSFWRVGQERRIDKANPRVEFRLGRIVEDVP